MKIQSINDVLWDETGGMLALRERNFEYVCFEDFNLNPIKGTEIVIENCRFTSCKVSEGTFAVMKGVILRDVSFLDFDCGNAMHISAEASLQNVRITGVNLPKMIWIRPQDQAGIVSDDERLSLDISEYEGEVSITGFPVHRIVINTDFQVIVKANLLERVDWKALGINPLSYWKMMAKKVSVDGCDAGVFSMPPKNGRNFERSMKELAVLRENGFI